jgi:hypothetical protein
MSTAPAGTSSNQPQRSSHQPGTLAILTATAVGGVIAARLGKTPFLLAAGAAALALLKPKKADAPRSVPQSLPSPVAPPEIPAQSQVEQWLSRQIMREEQAPVVELSAASEQPVEPEDDYSPPSFLLDEAYEVANAPTTNEAFAGLTEPMPQLHATPAPPMEQEAAQESPLTLPQALETSDTPPAAVDAAWTLGVEPLPSLSDAAPYVPPAGSPFFGAPVRQDAPTRKQEPSFSSMFSSAPVQQEDTAPPLFFAAAVFEGAAFPDEISVAPPTEPEAIPAAAAPTLEPQPERFNEPPPAVSTAPEILVELAAPGDASFDSPLAAVPQNPWETESDGADSTSVPPSQPQPTNPVVDAEIVLRPRAPMQNAVIAKSKFSPPAFFSAEGNETVPAESANDAHFPNPLQAPREPKQRAAWRSWWRGD